MALGFVVWMVPLRDRCTEAGCEPGLLTTLAKAKPTLVLAALLIYLAGTFAWSLRWRALLGLANVHLSALQTWRLTLEAQAGGILLPGGLGGDALRIAYVRERAPNAELAKVVASILVDRVVGLVTLASLATVTALVARATDLGPALGLLASIPLVASLGFVLLRLPQLRNSRLLSSPLPSQVLKPMVEYTAHERGPKTLAKGVLLSLVVSAVQLIIIRILVGALGSAPRSEAGLYVGTTFGMIVAAIPAIPGGWGTADAAYVVFLGRAGVTAQAAAAACLLYRIFWYVSGLLGAISALGRRNP